MSQPTMEPQNQTLSFNLEAGSDFESYDKDGDIEQLSSKLVVSGLPSTAHEDLLRFFFESRRNFGGLEVLDVEYDEENGSAIIEFENASDVDVVLEKAPIKLTGQIVHVERFQEPVEPRVVQVSGPLHVVKDLETLELYFENKRRSGGGDIDDLKYDDDLNVALVTFKEKEVAQRVVMHDRHEVQGRKLTVKQYTETKDKQINTEEVAETSDEDQVVRDTIKISNVSPSIKDTVELYFESNRRSGGGEICEVWNDDDEEDVIYIRFQNEQVAKTVAERTHSIKKQDLKVTIHKAPKPLPSHENKVVIKGLNTSTSQEALFNLIEAKSGLIPVALDYHERDKDVAMVTFDSKADVSKLKEMFKKFTLDGNTLKVMPVPISNCIIVTHLSDKITKDSIRFYFENRRKSGGGNVEKVTMNGDDTCLVYFVDYKVIDDVLKKEHNICDQTLFVQRYSDCLGRPEDDMQERALTIPAPIVFKDLDKYKVKFIINSVVQQNFEKQLQRCHCKVKWPNDADDSLVVECTITQSVIGCYKLVKAWESDVHKSVKSFMETLAVSKTEVLQAAWHSVLRKLNNVTSSNPENIALYLDKKASSVCIVGIKEDVSSLKRALDSIIADVLIEM